MFLNGWEGLEKTCFQGLHTALGKLPVPVNKPDSKKSHAAALGGGFIPILDEDQQKRLKPSELLLYMHRVEYRYLTSIYLDTSCRQLYIYCTFVIICISGSCT